MKRASILISFLTLLTFTFTVTAQNSQENEVKASLNSGTINSQFDYMYKKSFKWTDPKNGQRYKTIKVNDLYKFKQNVIDSLKLAQKKFETASTTIATQKNEIGTLKTDLGKTNENLTSVTDEKDSIRFLGIPLSKATYNTILWTLIAGLTALLVLFIGKFKRSNIITVDARNAKSEIEEEFENHRQRSIEREQKLRRELQDELNKQKYAKQNIKKK